jgi:hypothetical protein
MTRISIVTLLALAVSAPLAMAQYPAGQSSGYSGYSPPTYQAPPPVWTPPVTGAPAPYMAPPGTPQGYYIPPVTGQANPFAR